MPGARERHGQFNGDSPLGKVETLWDRQRCRPHDGGDVLAADELHT